MVEQPTYKYDVFVSYSHKDKDWVRDHLLPPLGEAKLKVMYDRLFEPGVPSIVNMERAVADSRRTLLVLTPDWVESQWTEFEALLAASTDPAGRTRRLIPVYLKDCRPASRIACLTHIDLIDEAERESEMKRLVACLAGGGDLAFEPLRGAPVQRGFMALSELLGDEQVRRAIVAFSIYFGEAKRQIEILSSYKDLHDLLHHLQHECYEPIAHEAERFPDDEEGRENLLAHESRLRELMEELSELATNRPPIREEVAEILEDLASATEILHSSVVAADAKLLARVVKNLNHVLALRPTRINMRLTEAARALNLQGLAESMKTVCSRLRELNIRPEQVDQFETGVSALERLTGTLTTLVGHHDRWQKVEQELRQIAGDLTRSLDELQASWPRLKRLVEALYAGSDESWAQALRSDGENLESRLAAQDALKIRHHFRAYRRQAERRFFRVDDHLKRQCHELRQASEPLATVLRILG